MVAFAGSTLLAFSSAQAARMQQAFSYDAAGRLTNVVTDSGSAKISLNEHYQFDASGNIIEKVVDGQTVRMSYDAANQLMSRTDREGTVNFAYDSAGRLVAERKNGEVIAKYEYGYLDKVTQVTRGEQVTQFHYNARGMLVAKERDGKITETFGWDGIGLLAKNDTVYANESHVSGGVPLAAVHAGSENAEMQYFDSDYLGTTTAVYSADGQVDAKLVGSYGAGSESSELRFTGKPYDADLDAHVFPYRNYKSEAGRWASADPAGFPDGPNQHYYACVPTMGLDPLGLIQLDSGLSSNYSSSSTVLSNLSPSQTAIDGYQNSITDGPPTNNQITDGFANGSGPNVNASNLSGVYAQFDPSTNIITIDTDLLQAVENGDQGAALLLEVTIGHEMAHYFDNLDGTDTAGEEGASWETFVFGVVVDWSNVNNLGPEAINEL
jgi:RHS repeat-associated protein